MPLIRIRDISASDTEVYFDGDYDHGYTVKTGDYLVGMDGDFNLRRWAGKDALLNQRVMRINQWRCKVDHEFIRIPLQIILDFLHGVTSQTTVKHLSAKQVNGIEIPLPPIEEQHRIVAKVEELMALCDQFEAARAVREATRDRLAAASVARLNAPNPETFTADAIFALDTLPSLTARTDQVKRLRHAILNLAVRGKLGTQQALEGEGQGATSGPYEIPAGWKWAPTKDLCAEIIDCPHSTAKFESAGVACIDTNCFKGGRLLLNKLRFVSEETYAVRIARLEPRAGDVVFAREGSVGESVIIPEQLRCCLGQRVMLFRPGESVTPEYFQMAISEPSSVERLVAMHKGIGAKHVNVKDMRNTLLPVPPLVEQRRIVAKVEELMKLCDQLEANLTAADDARRRLLDALLAEALQPALQAAA